MSTQISDKIEGVPDGWRLVAFRPPRQGEYYISAYTGEVLELNHGGPFCSVAIVVPDNVYGLRDPLKDVLAPHGFKAVAFRVPRSGEAWISQAGSVVGGVMDLQDVRVPHVIVEPLPPPPKPKRSVLVIELPVPKGALTFEMAQNHVDLWPETYRLEERDA